MRTYCRASKTFLVALLMMTTAQIPAQPATTETAARRDIYMNGWIDLNKNGSKDPYEDPAVDVEARIADLIGRMTMEEKTMQLVTLYGFKRVLQDPLPTPAWKEQPWKDGIANIDEHANGVSGVGEEYARPASRHADVINTVQRWFVEETRLGIPVDFTNEGIRGLCAWGATSFPNQVGVASAWDRQLAADIGTVIAKEARALGFTHIYSPILDLARDPRWGRVVECYSEDPYLTSELGVAHVKAIQAEKVAASPKHFANYSMPKGGRDGGVRTDPHASFREMEVTLLAPFREVFKRAGAMGTMASYNDYSGFPIIADTDFQVRRLRQEWGFKGYIVSDSGAVEKLHNTHFVSPDSLHSTAMVINGGMNVRTDFNDPMRFVGPLREAVAQGLVTEETINSRVADVLRVKYWQGTFDKPYVEDEKAADAMVGNADHHKLALEASRKSLVLLKNANNTLPLNKSIKSVLVTGPWADDDSYADNRYGPYKPESPSIVAAMKLVGGGAIEVKHAVGSSFHQERWPRTEVIPEVLNEKEKAQIAEAVAQAQGVDAIVVCVGENGAMVGESQSRTSLDLPRPQQDLVEAMVATGKPVIVVLINGRALSINWIDENAGAVIEAWNPGQYGGQAIAETIFGDNNPSGKLPVTFPRTVGQIPWNFPAMPSSQKWQDKKGKNWVGKTRVDGEIYPFGHGLSYSTFEFKNLKIEPAEQSKTGNVTVTAEVTNTGERAGDAVAQLYLRDRVSSVITYESNLRGFERVSLAPGETKPVKFTLGPEDLQLMDKDGKWLVEPGEFIVRVGDSSQNTPLEGRFTITE